MNRKNGQVAVAPDIVGFPTSVVFFGAITSKRDLFLFLGSGQSLRTRLLLMTTFVWFLVSLMRRKSGRSSIFGGVLKNFFLPSYKPIMSLSSGHCLLHTVGLDTEWFSPRDRRLSVCYQLRDSIAQALYEYFPKPIVPHKRT